MTGLDIKYLEILPDIANSIPLSEFKDWLCLDEFGLRTGPNRDHLIACLDYCDADREEIILNTLASMQEVPLI